MNARPTSGCGGCSGCRPFGRCWGRPPRAPHTDPTGASARTGSTGRTCRLNSPVTTAHGRSGTALRNVPDHGATARRGRAEGAENPFPTAVVAGLRGGTVRSLQDLTQGVTRAPRQQHPAGLASISPTGTSTCAANLDLRTHVAALACSHRFGGNQPICYVRNGPTKEARPCVATGFSPSRTKQVPVARDGHLRVHSAPQYPATPRKPV